MRLNTRSRRRAPKREVWTNPAHLRPVSTGGDSDEGFVLRQILARVVHSEEMVVEPLQHTTFTAILCIPVVQRGTVGFLCRAGPERAWKDFSVSLHIDRESSGSEEEDLFVIKDLRAPTPAMNRMIDSYSTRPAVVQGVEVIVSNALLPHKPTLADENVIEAHIIWGQILRVAPTEEPEVRLNHADGCKACADDGPLHTGVVKRQSERSTSWNRREVQLAAHASQEREENYRVRRVTPTRSLRIHPTHRIEEK